MYCTLVLRCGLDPGYVLDRMELYEIVAILENIWMKDKESWEQARLQVYSTGNLKESITFPWDKDVKTEKIEATKEEKEALMKEMKEWENIMNNNDLNNGK